MIRNLQHARLVKASSALRLARRQVYFDCQHGTSSSASSSSSGLFLTSSSRAMGQSSSRTFSSSRPYATVLHSDDMPSTSLRQPPPQALAGASAERSSSPSSSAPSSTVNANATTAATRLQTILVRPPSKEALEEEDQDVVDGAEARFQISPRAAEQLRHIAQRESNPDIALRVAVESGGCHGYQYKIDLTDLSEGAGDYHFSAPKISPSNVLIDPVSLSLLSGSTLDFATELIGSTFRVTDNPHAAGGCGCGVSWEAKLD